MSKAKITLFLLLIFTDIVLTGIGLRLGMSEANALALSTGDINLFRMVTASLFLLGWILLDDTRYERAARRALNIVLVILLAATAWNVGQFLLYLT